MLVDDLNLKPKNPQPLAPLPAATAPRGPRLTQRPPPFGAPPARLASRWINSWARPGALVSGKAKFSDGKTAEWFLDQAGRLGLAPSEKATTRPKLTCRRFKWRFKRNWKSWACDRRGKLQNPHSELIAKISSH